MEQLIEDLMVLSQVKGTKMIFEDVNLSNIALEIILRLRQTYPDREVEFICAENH
ncbi:MAG: hypothetical protein HC908_16385 [Calothrix sp. SM1_7_51]|nr:hypothetical protein [Calothrix sp. SM1_7_51]